MATVIVMPRLSPTMEEGVLAKWTKNEGDKIAPGDIIAEVETDKANMDFPLEDEGVLLKQLAKAGETVKLGAPVGILGEAGEDVSQVLAEIQGGGAAPKAEAKEEAKPEAKAEAKPEAKPEAKAEAKPAQKSEKTAESAEKSEKTAEKAAKTGENAEKPAQVAEKGAKAEAAEAAAPAEGESEGEDAGEAGGARTVASPLARRLAGDAGLDIRKVKGTGPGGRIIKRDIEAAVAAGKKAPAPKQDEPGKAAAPADKGGKAETGDKTAGAQQLAAGDELVPLSMMRRTAAKRLVESKQTVPHFYLTSEAPVDALLAFREQLNAAGAPSPLSDKGDTAGKGGDKVSVNDLVLKALARALRVVPAANMSIAPDGQHLIKHNRVDISVAVALEDGLITPVVRAADQKSLGAISREVRELAGRGRDKKLRPEEYTGGTFSLTNLGMFGIREFFAIINPPESGILAVGKVDKRAVVVEHDGRDEVKVERRMTLTLSCDHRVIDGALGAKLLAEVVRGLSQPMLLVL